LARPPASGNYDNIYGLRNAVGDELEDLTEVEPTKMREVA
jgi:hypothetical protein